MKPRALDLFCCAGGATRGLQEAGFHVTGVDIKPQHDTLLYDVHSKHRPDEESRQPYFHLARMCRLRIDAMGAASKHGTAKPRDAIRAGADSSYERESSFSGRTIRSGKAADRPPRMGISR